MGDENKIYDNIEYCKVNNINNDEITSDPEIINYKYAIVVPPISNNNSSGVFDIYGNLIIPSALINGKEKKLDHVNPSYSIDVDEYPINVKNIYWGGCITNHYGHFIMDVLPRWWAYDEYKKLGYKLGLNIKGETEDKILSLKWLQQFLTILNIEIEDIYIFKIVTKVNNLSIPYPLIMDRTYYHSKLSYFFNKIGEIAEKFVPPHKFTGEYYLSRKNLRAGTRKITNESEIEDIMLRNGIEVLYPEDLTLFEQISIFRRGRVYGFISSAFHNSAFSLNSEGICFSIDKEINRSFSLFDSSSKSKIIYLHIPYEPAEAEYGFFVCVKIKSIGKLESAIVSYRKNELANITSYKNNKSKFHYEHNKNGPFLLENTFGGLAKFVGNEIIFNIKNEDNVFVFIYGDVAFFCSSLDYIVYKNKFFGVDKNKSNDKYSFRDINSDLYVSLDITKIGVILSCDRAQKMDWEEFTLKPCEPNEDYFTYLVNDFLGLGDYPI